MIGLEVGDLVEFDVQVYSGMSAIPGRHRPVTQPSTIRGRVTSLNGGHVVVKTMDGKCHALQQCRKVRPPP